MLSTEQVIILFDVTLLATTPYNFQDFIDPHVKTVQPFFQDCDVHIDKC